MIRLDLKERNYYTGFLNWMTENIGKPNDAWEWVTEDNAGYQVVVGVTISDPHKELLAIMRWS